MSDHRPMTGGQLGAVTAFTAVNLAALPAPPLVGLPVLLGSLAGMALYFRRDAAEDRRICAALVIAAARNDFPSSELIPLPTPERVAPLAHQEAA